MPTERIITMQYLMQQIDSDTKWLIIALLVLALFTVLAWGIGLKLTIRANKREHERAEAQRDKDCLAKIYQDVNIPAYMRNERFENRDKVSLPAYDAKHALDSLPTPADKVARYRAPKR